MNFGPNPIFSSKDAAKCKTDVDSWLVEKIFYYILTPVTPFCTSKSKAKKLIRGKVCTSAVEKPVTKLLFWYRALPWPRELLPLTCIRV